MTESMTGINQRPVVPANLQCDLAKCLVLEKTSDCGQEGLSGEKIPFLVLCIKTGRGI